MFIGLACSRIAWLLFLPQVEYESKVACDVDNTVTEETPLGQCCSQALHIRSQWSTAKAEAVEADLRIATGYWNYVLCCLVCLRCGGRIDDPAWYGGESAAGAEGLKCCSCTSANDLLITPLKLKAVEVVRDGTNTKVYLQVPRTRAAGRENEWLKTHKKHPPDSPRTMAIKLTEVIRQGQKVHETVYTGYIRLGAKNIMEVDKDREKIRVGGAPLRPQSQPVDEQAPEAAASAARPEVDGALALLELLRSSPSPSH